MCVSELKKKRMQEQQKSKRKALINNLRKKAYEEDHSTYQAMEQSQQQANSQMVFSQNNQQLAEQQLISLDDISNVANSGYSASNPDDPSQSLNTDFNFMMTQNGMISDVIINNNSNHNSGKLEETEGGAMFNQHKTTCSPQDIINLIQLVYKGEKKLSYKESRMLKQELNLLRKNLVNINNGMNNSDYNNNQIQSQNINIMDYGDEIQNIQQNQQNEIQNKKIKEAELFNNDIEKMIQVFQGMIYIVQNKEKFSMDVVYECIWILSNYSSTEEMRNEILIIYENNVEVLLNFVHYCVRMVDQQQASILLTKVILIIGNISLESQDFCQRILMYQQNQLLTNIQNTILYLPNSQLVAETMWLLNIFYKTQKFYYQNENISKNIAFLLNRFKSHPRVVQELLWYLISLSQDGDSQFHMLYFDESVITRILTVLLLSTHNGNTIACLTLLSNALAMLPQERTEFITTLVTESEIQVNNQVNLDIVISKYVQYNPNQKNALFLALNKCIQSNIIEIQRECFVFISNLVVLFPLYIAQLPVLINILIQIFQNGQEQLFVDLCYIFSNLFIQLPQSNLLAQQHPQLIPLLQTILSNENIQKQYSQQIGFIFQHFANFLHSTKF
ncbi:hypothetical protein ABPG74_016831 [Tetrahymena malaccensis]